MNVLLVGSGGREHALALGLSQSSTVSRVYVVPGNGGTDKCNPKVSNAHIPLEPQFDSLLQFARDQHISLIVCGPEQPLVDGIHDAFKQVGIPVFGPTKRAARLEGSKAFSKAFMQRHRIPTAEYATFSDYAQTKAYCDVRDPTKLVVKASGLAAGKGVILPDTREQLNEALVSIMVDRAFGEAGHDVVVEERLEGEEVSCLAFTDGYTVVPLPPAQDHKRIFDGDKGPNTGGMGAYAPAPVATPELMERIKRTILQPTVDGMRRDGVPFQGLLYAGIMVTESGPSVLEYNCRFGDPETQVVVPLLEEDCDLAEIMLACTEGRLDSVRISFKPNFAATVVMAAKGYPGSYAKGDVITLPTSLPHDVHAYHAGTTLDKGTLVTSGGRVLAVTAVAPTLEQALAKAYTVVGSGFFKDAQFRKDIGHRALTRLAQQAKAKHSATYADAGVSVDAGNVLVEKIKPIVKATRRVGADADIGGFGGNFDLAALKMHDPILVSSTDGVGTKLKIAHAVRKHDTIGIDLVAMNANDVIVQGAEPLFFLDYYACSKLDVDVASDVVSGIARGCSESGCALIGGETAEMPGFYQPGDYDLAGFVVGVAERDQLLPNMAAIQPGDAVIGLPSSGVHSNGFSLVRHIIAKQNLSYTSPCPFAQGVSLGEALLVPTRLYVKPLLPIVRKRLIKGMAHITGGGFTDNIPRTLPTEMGVTLDATKWSLPPVFKWLKRMGNVSNDEMARTFNCGIGMVMIVAQTDVAQVLSMLKENGELGAVEMGMVVHKGANGGKQVKVNHMDMAWS